MNARDSKANAELKNRILSSRTATGETVADALGYTATQIPFSISNWQFVYARSGSEYAVLTYGESARDSTPDGRRRTEAFLDYDLETDPVFSLRNSHANGMLVWKVNGGQAEPWGSYANMLALGGKAFTWAVNDGRRGFKGSSFDAALARNFGFLGELPDGSGRVSESLDIGTAKEMSFFWNVVDGYAVSSESFPCPDRKVGVLTVKGKACAEQAAAARDIEGRVLPFRVMRAIRNEAFVNGMVLADASISVEDFTTGNGQFAPW